MFLGWLKKQPEPVCLKKEKAQKTMGTKEKTQEIKSLLDQEITPKLNKQKRSFIQYQKSATELEGLGRPLCACEWQDAYDRVGKKQKEVEGKENNIREGQFKEESRKKMRASGKGCCCRAKDKRRGKRGRIFG